MYRLPFRAPDRGAEKQVAAADFRAGCSKCHASERLNTKYNLPQTGLKHFSKATTVGGAIRFHRRRQLWQLSRFPQNPPVVGFAFDD